MPAIDDWPTLVQNLWLVAANGLYQGMKYIGTHADLDIVRQGGEAALAQVGAQEQAQHRPGRGWPSARPPLIPELAAC